MAYFAEMLAERRWQLKEHGAELGAEHPLGAFDEEPPVIFDIDKPLLVSHLKPQFGHNKVPKTCQSAPGI